MVISITVCILQTQSTTSQSILVKSLFSYTGGTDLDDISFNVITADARGTNLEKSEYLAVKNVISDSNTYTIFILDTSISSSSPETIYNAIKGAIRYNNRNVDSINLDTDPWDLCYLCKWLDNCAQYTVVGATEGNSTSHMVKTSSPYGFQAVLFSPSCVQKAKTLFNTIGEEPSKSLSLILHDQVGTEKWSAFTFTPNLVAFDTTLSRNGSYDYVKSTECRDPLPITATQRSSNMNFFWFIITFFLVVAFTYFLIVLGPKLIDWLQGVPPVKMCLLTSVSG